MEPIRKKKKTNFKFENLKWKYSCKKCEFKTNDFRSLGGHYKNSHGKGSIHKKTKLSFKEKRKIERRAGV